MNKVLTGKDVGSKVVRGRLLVVKEMAMYLRVSESWICKKMQEGKLPFRWWVFSERGRVADSADIDEWLSKTSMQPGQIPASLPDKSIKKIQKEVNDR